MKTTRCLMLLGVLTGTLLVSGCCMAPMMAGMMLGHGDHKKEGTAQGRVAKHCECENCGGSNSQSSAAPVAAPAGNTAPTASAHKH